MLKIVVRAGLVALAAIVCSGSGASAAMHMPASAAMLAGETQAAQVTFWARPFPYGYTPWRRCARVRVETPHGWAWERVCPAPRGVILQRAY